MTVYNALPEKSMKESSCVKPPRRFNAAVTSIKSLDPSDSRKNHVRKFIRALPLKWRASSIEMESQDIDEEEVEAFNFLARNFLKGNRFRRGNRFGSGANRFGRGHRNSFGNKGGESSKQKGACYNCRVEGHFTSVFLGFSQTSKAYIVLNKETMIIEESLDVTFDESLPEPKSSSSVENDRIDEPIVQDLNGSPSLQVNISDEGYSKSLKEARGHLIE
nr:retrovirus-related Pol polyprotein from transposon TNT 1-94 [Tanacetum cinerariifolium]